MAYPTGMLEFALLGSMRRREAARATTPLMMTMVPGPPAQRSALAAVAVTTQVQEAIRREGRAADAAIAAARTACASDTPLTLDDLRNIPGLRDVANDARLAALNSIGDIVRQGTGLIRALHANGGPIAWTERAKYPAFLDLLSADEQTVLIQQRPAAPQQQLGSAQEQLAALQLATLQLVAARQLAAQPQPVVQQPVAPQPVVQQPVVQQPVAPQPVVQQPVVQQPVAPQPVVQQPVAPQPAVDQQAALLLAAWETLMRPASHESVAPQPVVQQPVAPQPPSDQPAQPQPAQPQPVVQQPVAPQPPSGQPAQPQPAQPQPVVQQPVAPQPPAEQPAQPAVQQPVESVQKPRRTNPAT